MLVTLGAVFLSLIVFGEAASLKLQRRGLPDVITKCTVPNKVALTFDDGPYIYLKEVVDTLKKANAKGTFFFNGKNWACIYDPDSVSRVKYAYDNGFQVASHTWAHQHLPTLSYDQVNSEMSRAEEAIKKITGALPAFTRPPYGEYNDNVRTVARDRGQTLVNWDFDSGDSTGKTVAQQEALYDKVAIDRPSTILSLQHEVYQSSVQEVLPHAIKKLQDAKYELVTLAECLGLPAYKSIGGPVDVSGEKCT